MPDLTLEEIKQLVDRAILPDELCTDTYSRGWNAALLLIRDDARGLSRSKIK
jgi:hypothetical protein